MFCFRFARSVFADAQASVPSVCAIHFGEETWYLALLHVVCQLGFVAHVLSMTLTCSGGPHCGWRVATAKLVQVVAVEAVAATAKTFAVNISRPNYLRD